MFSLSVSSECVYFVSDFLILVNIGTQNFYLLPSSVSREDIGAWNITNARRWEEEIHKWMDYHKKDVRSV